MNTSCSLSLHATTPLIDILINFIKFWIRPKTTLPSQLSSYRRNNKIHAHLPQRLAQFRGCQGNICSMSELLECERGGEGEKVVLMSAMSVGNASEGMSLEIILEICCGSSATSVKQSFLKLLQTRYCLSWARLRLFMREQIESAIARYKELVRLLRLGFRTDIESS